MGLPRFVKYFQEACVANPGKVESIIDHFTKKVNSQYNGVGKRSVEFIKALLQQMLLV